MAEWGGQKLLDGNFLMADPGLGTVWLYPKTINNTGMLERAAGIEPAWLAWKARALPLSNARRWEAQSPDNVLGQL